MIDKNNPLLIGLLLAIVGGLWFTEYGWPQACFGGFRCNTYIGIELVLIYLAAFYFPDVWKKWDQRKRTTKFMKIDLEPGKTNFKEVKHDLVIVNKVRVRSSMTIDTAHVYYNGSVILPSPNSSELKKGEKKTMSFIMFSNNPANELFTIRNTGLEFGEGRHKFAVSITFSPPGGVNMFTNWYDITVEFKRPNQFKVTVRHLPER